MRTPSNHPDLRVIKTKKAIRRAFTELLTEKDIDSITIKDIAERAIINRKTIYNYYRGVYQIVEDIENGIAADLDTAVRELEQRPVPYLSHNYRNDRGKYRVLRGAAADESKLRLCDKNKTAAVRASAPGIRAQLRDDSGDARCDG